MIAPARAPRQLAVALTVAALLLGTGSGYTTSARAGSPRVPRRLDEASPHPCDAACVCGATDGALESWDLSAIAGPRGTDAEVGTWSYLFDVCGDVPEDDLPAPCADAGIVSSQAVRFDGGDDLCEQLAPSFDSDAAGEDLQVTALDEGGGGVRLAYSFTDEVGQLRELTLDLLCDPDGTGTAPDEAVCEDFQCFEVSVQWSTAAACSDDPAPDPEEPEPEPELPPAPTPGDGDGDDEEGLDIYIIVIGAVAGLCVIQGLWLVVRDRCAGKGEQQRTRRESMNIDPKGSGAIMPWAKREKKEKPSRKEKKSRRKDYEKIAAVDENGDDLTDWIQKTNAKAAAKDHIGLLAPKHSSKSKPKPASLPGLRPSSGGGTSKLGGDDRFPTKRDHKKWEAKQREERQQAGGDDGPERNDGVGRRGGRLTMGDDVVVEVETDGEMRSKRRRADSKHGGDQKDKKKSSGSGSRKEKPKPTAAGADTVVL